ncbi:hypothetical protein Acr_03g0011990 [Actinidia rufa]|uniref:Uncharacterized protein n=1 Tax=Actinidia rufa TaxID=165716 RepID=A0A7J0EDB2_9ERIC|nr:hypothetical protein Acr_03g0011990 [Actinidia rufa]
MRSWCSFHPWIFVVLVKILSSVYEPCQIHLLAAEAIFYAGEELPSILMAPSLHGIRERPGIHLVAWKVLCLPKKGGGLGIRDLVLFNKPMLGKWIWRFVLGEDKLWCRVLNGKYGIISGACRTKVITHPYGTVPLPELFTFATNQDALVADYWFPSPVGGFWAPLFRRWAHDWELEVFVEFFCCKKCSPLVRKLSSGGGRGMAKEASQCLLSIILLRVWVIPPSLGKGFGSAECLVRCVSSVGLLPKGPF